MIGSASRLSIGLLTLIYLFSAALPPDALPAGLSNSPARLRKQFMSDIARAVGIAIRKKQVPGAVILVGKGGKVIYRRAFGSRSLKPGRSPMTIDTIFDISSLTKVVATATAVMQLAERGKLGIEDRVSAYWPEFGENGKEQITIRELLTHYSGLRPDLDLDPKWSGYDTAMKKIVGEKTVCPPGTRFIYSDINFEVLGELVRRVSGLPLDRYCSEHIFGPLGMKNTFFTPPERLRERIAPTEKGKDGKILCGSVHDPAAARMGGIAGHAGLFSTADDLSIFANMLLSGGSVNGVRILDTAAIDAMTRPQNPPGSAALRGLGWDIDSPFSSCRGKLFPSGSYGHTGYTGTSIWIDPASGTYVIILTNRVHPDGKGNVIKLRAQIATIVAEAAGAAPARTVSHTRRIMTGIDVLEADNFRPLSGLRVGLITNRTGLDSKGRSTLTLLHKAPDVELAAIFSPEHGLSGKLDRNFDSTTDPATGLPVYSLYGSVRRPTEKMLEGLDALVFDIQDAGVRFYTYITTLGYAMEAAAGKGIKFYVLDRPNPITGSIVQGPVMERDLKSFTGYFPLPVRHGMTVGELAGMFNDEYGIGAELEVVMMRGYDRAYWYDETGLPWVDPSPNLRSLTEEVFYPGVALVEGAAVSVGRGTDKPFELLGAPWIRAEELSDYLNKRKIRGVRFSPAYFRPDNGRFEKKACRGVRLTLTDRRVLDPTILGIEIASALYRLYPRSFKLDETLPLIGSRRVLSAIREGRDPIAIASQWQEELEQFRSMRAKYLLY